MSNAKILIVDDEEDLRELVSYNLRKEGYEVMTAESGSECLKIARDAMPDLIVLDLMMPNIDGLECCRIIRGDAKIQHIPIIMLTAKSEETDIVVGLELGADDYVTKPFSPKILAVRIKSVLRRGREKADDTVKVVKCYNLVINPARREVLVSGEPVKLTFTEFEVLHLLARKPGWVLSRNQIINAIRGGGYPVTERSIDVQVVGLRKKLGEAGKYIETIRGVGYRFQD